MIELLIFGLVLLSVICLWLLIEGRKSPKFLIWFIPLLLILVSSTYMTYTAIQGYPKFETPKRGLYLKHYIDEPNWIYIWVIDKEQIPISYKIVYSREVHNAMEGVKGKAEEGSSCLTERYAPFDFDSTALAQVPSLGCSVGHCSLWCPLWRRPGEE